MTSRSSTRAGGGWRVPALLLALLLALALTSAAAPPAHAGNDTFCPNPSGYVNLNVGAACVGPFNGAITRVSYFQNPPVNARCAYAKAGSTESSSTVITVICGAGSGTWGEVFSSAGTPQAGYPRGRNDSASPTGYNYFGVYYW